MGNMPHIKGWQQKISCNDEQAFAELFRYFYDRLLRFSIQYVHVREAAEEIVSDVFVKIWNRRSTITAIDNLEVYLFVAVRNLSLNYLEQFSSLRIMPLSDSGISQLTNTVDPEREMEWKEILFKMDQEVCKLPEQCRKVFRLIKEEGFKYKEVAAILNISPRTVETQLFRAMRRLNEVIGPYVSGKRAPKINPPFMLLFALQIFMKSL
jgi:RNA polymerase sigma-70 factor (family 1)